MNKEGHLGVVKNTHQPIIKKMRKVEINSNLLRPNQKHQNSTLE